jgi:uncharacterized membrane protein YesL
MRATAFDSALRRLSDNCLIGFLTVLGCLPLVTLLASLAAGAHARQAESFREMLRSYFQVYRARIRPTFWMSALAVIVTCSGVIDLFLLAPAIATPGVTIALAALGALSIIATVGLTPFLASTSEVQAPAVARIRGALRVAFLCPETAAVSLALTVAMGVAALVLPILIVPLMGFYVRQMAGIEETATRRISTARTLPR